MAWLNVAYNSRKLKPLDNTGNGAKTSYPVKVTIDSSETDFWDNITSKDEIRVTTDDGVTEIPFWIALFDHTGDDMTLWVNVSSIGAGATVNIYVYYNNASPTNGEDIASVFLFGEDFRDVTTLVGDMTEANPTIFNSDGYSNPVIPLGATDQKDDTVIREHSPIYWDPDGLQWVVLYAGEINTTNEKSIILATSTDKINWTKNYIIDSAAQDDNPTLLYDVTNGQLKKDDENNYLLFCENDPPADDMKLWKSASLTSGWTEFGTVISVGAASEWDDHQIGNPTVFWPGSGTTIYMLYEGLESGGPDIGAMGFATSTDWGETWTKYTKGVNDSDPIKSPTGTFWDTNVIAPIWVIKSGSTYIVGLVSGQNYAGRVSTTDDPSAWDDTSFSIMADESYLKNGFHVNPFLGGPADTDKGYVLFQKGAQDGLYLANILGGSKWQAKRYASDTERSVAQQDVEDDDKVPIYIDSSDQLVINSEAPAGTTPHGIYLHSVATITNDWEIVVRMKQEDGASFDTWWNLNVGKGSVGQPTGYTPAFDDAYMLLTEDPGSANSINLREITAGSLGARQQANNYAAAHANAMNERSLSYLADGTLAYAAGAATGSISDENTLLNDAKKIMIVQGEHGTSGGAKSTIDYIICRKYDGENVAEGAWGAKEDAPSGVAKTADYLVKARYLRWAQVTFSGSPQNLPGIVSEPKESDNIHRVPNIHSRA